MREPNTPTSYSSSNLSADAMIASVLRLPLPCNHCILNVILEVSENTHHMCHGSFQYLILFACLYLYNYLILKYLPLSPYFLFVAVIL